jgi:hypothetical protein
VATLDPAQLRHGRVRGRYFRENFAQAGIDLTRGWVREIARKDEDSHVEAEFEPETGTLTVYEGRREFKALERASR